MSTEGLYLCSVEVVRWLQQFSIKGLYDSVEGLCLNELTAITVFSGIFDGVTFCVKSLEE